MLRSTIQFHGDSSDINGTWIRPADPRSRVAIWQNHLQMIHRLQNELRES